MLHITFSRQFDFELMKTEKSGVRKDCMLKSSYSLVSVFHYLPSHHDGLVLNAKLLHPCSIQLPQQTHDAGLLPRAGWTVHQQVWEVSTLNLKQGGLAL